MTTFNDREKGFENKFAHDEQMQFKAAARRNKLVGLWAASLLGKAGAEADAYAMEVVRADFIEVGHEDVFRKLAGRSRLSRRRAHDPLEDGRDAGGRQSGESSRSCRPSRLGRRVPWGQPRGRGAPRWARIQLGRVRGGVAVVVGDDAALAVEQDLVEVPGGRIALRLPPSA